MKLLDRHLGLSIVFGTLGAVLVLLTLLGFLALMDELEEVGQGNYGVVDACMFVALILPRYLYEVFPIAALLGSLIGLGTLASHSELIAMRAAGVSFSRIVLAVLKTGVAMMLFVAVVGELVAPEAEQYAQGMRAQKQKEQVTLKTRYGFWARDGNAFVNIRNILPGSQLADIYIYEFDKQRRLQFATYAAFAQYQEDHWQLGNIRQTRFTQDGVEIRTLDNATWESMLDPGLLSVVAVNPNVLPAWGLYRYISFMRANGQDAKSYEVAFWGKLVTPLVTLVMLFLSTPFVFGVLRHVGIGQRLFVGALVGSGFFLMNKAFSYMAVVYDLNPLFAASFPGFLVLFSALWFSRKVR